MATRKKSRASGDEAAAKTTDAASAPRGRPSPDDRAQVLVLVVDDEPEILALVVPYLRAQGYPVIEANDGDEAIEAILVERPRVVVLDVMMPGLSGWEVCRYVRSRTELEGVRILMATGIGPDTNAATSPLYGADDAIDKPFRLESLREKVDDLVQRILAGEL